MVTVAEGVLHPPIEAMALQGAPFALALDDVARDGPSNAGSDDG